MGALLARRRRRDYSAQIPRFGMPSQENGLKLVIPNGARYSGRSEESQRTIRHPSRMHADPRARETP
jgi:hypothetical protein